MQKTITASEMPNRSERTPSGIKGLDELVGGGLPKGRVILLTGEPGSGKTIFGTQYLVNGIKEYDETGLLVCMEEIKSHLYSEMKLFGWDLAKFEEAGKLAFVDATPLRLLPEKVKVGEVAIARRDFSMVTLIQAINKEVERINPARIVVDPITSLIIQYPDDVARRGAILELIGALVSCSATCLITSELKNFGRKRRVEMEEFLAHGVVVLQNLLVRGSMIRAIQVEKMRETNCDNQPRIYRINSGGIEVFPKESVFK